MRTPWTGVGTALVTPFTSSGALDEAGVRRLARRQIDGGMHFLVPCGTTGETPTLSEAERRRVVELVVEEANGRVPVMAGAGGYDTREVVHAAREMQKAGANGLLSVTPYYNKPTPEGLFQHFSAIADATDLPIVVYNVPGRTGCNMEPATLARLATIPHIVGVKEASGNIQQMAEICRAVPRRFHRAVRRRCDHAAADGDRRPRHHLGGLERDAGGDGADRRGRRARRLQAARALHHRLLPLMLVNFVESNPGPVKCAMAAMGLCEEMYRLPMVPPRQARGEDLARPARSSGCPRRRRVSDERSQATSKRCSPRARPRDKREARAAFRRAARRARRRRGARGRARSGAASGWRVNAWVKQGILLGFRFGDVVDMTHGRWPSSTRTRCR